MIVPFRGAADWEREAPRVAAHLHAGGLIAYPTETVYGLGSVVEPATLERLAALKGREAEKPFLLLITGPDQVPGLEWTDAAIRLAETFWPGPLTLALHAEPGRFPQRVVGREGTVAVRSSPHPGVRSLVDALGGPLTSTSANLPGRPPATRIEEVLSVVRALNGAEDLWLLDGGALPPSAPSTIVDVSGARPRVVRPGAIPTEQLRMVVVDLDG